MGIFHLAWIIPLSVTSGVVLAALMAANQGESSSGERRYSAVDEDRNIVYMVTTYGGDNWNVKAENIVEAANKAAKEIDPREIFMIVDIPG